MRYTFVDPTGSVAGDDLVGGALDLGQLPEEQVEHLAPMPGVHPDDPAAVVVDKNMAAALIDRTVHHGRLIRFEGRSYRNQHALMTK